MAQPGLACLTGGQKVGGSNPLAPNYKALCNKSLRKAVFLPLHSKSFGATPALRCKAIMVNKISRRHRENNVVGSTGNRAIQAICGGRFL